MGVPVGKIGLIFCCGKASCWGQRPVTGLPAGILFSKLFYAAGQSDDPEIQIPFYILKAIGWLLLILAVIILVMGLKNYWMVRRSKLIEILNTARQDKACRELDGCAACWVWPVSLQLIIWLKYFYPALDLP